MALKGSHLKEGHLQSLCSAVEPTSSLMSSHAQSALAGLDFNFEDCPESLLSVSSRTTGHATNDLKDICSYYSCYHDRDRLMDSFRPSEQLSFNLTWR